MRPFADHYRYFERINPCFPILDGEARLAVGQETVSPTLRACLLAHTMVFWKQLRKRAGEHCPDIRFVWNQANEALYSELYLSPGMQTLSAILLNIAGRPLTSMIGNGILLGSAISLAHSLGLHLDSRNEDIPRVEKLGRERMWWVIVVLDKWWVTKSESKTVTLLTAIDLIGLLSPTASPRSSEKPSTMSVLQTREIMPESAGTARLRSLSQPLLP